MIPRLCHGCTPRVTGSCLNLQCIDSKQAQVCAYACHVAYVYACYITILYRCIPHIKRCCMIGTALSVRSRCPFMHIVTLVQVTTMDMNCVTSTVTESRMVDDYQLILAASRPLICCRTQGYTHVDGETSRRIPPSDTIKRCCQILYGSQTHKLRRWSMSKIQPVGFEKSKPLIHLEFMETGPDSCRS